jgi:hypothetical protein
MWPLAIGAPQRKRMAISKTVTISKLLTRAEAMINDLADAAFMATVNCRLPLPLQTIALLLGCR